MDIQNKTLTNKHGYATLCKVVDIKNFQRNKKEEIEKWLALKGETKYMRFASILNANGIVVK